MATIVLTGSSGMLGSAVGERLIAEGHDLIGVDVRPNRWVPELEDRTLHLDLLDRDNLGALPDDPDYLLHFAANARVRNSIADPSLAIENRRIVDHVLQYLCETSEPRILFASSREVYGESGVGEVAEDTVNLEACGNPYGASKISNEAMIYAYEECYGISPVILRFSNIYGKYDVSDRVVPLFLAQASDDQPIHVYGEEKSLDFCHIEDCADAVLTALDRFDKIVGHSINIGANEDTTLVRLANTIKEVTDSNSSIHVESNREGEIEHFVADIRRANRLLNFEPTYTLNEGITEAASWYQARPELFDEIKA